MVFLQRLYRYPIIQRLYSSSSSRRPSYIHNVGSEPLKFRTIGEQLSLSADKYGDREALVSCHENRRITYGQVKEKADQLAAAFQSLGLEPGSRIGIWAPNISSWYLTMMGAARAGLILVGLNPAYQKPEMEYCLKKVGVRAIIVPETYKTQQYVKMLADIMPEMEGSPAGCVRSETLPQLSTIIVDAPADKQFKGAFNLHDVYRMATADQVAAVEPQQGLINPDSGCNIQFTSGTTGHPKATLLSHFNFVNNGYHIGKRMEFAEKPHKICFQVPFFHAYGIVIGIMAALHYGTTIVLPDAGFNPAKSLEAIVKEQCTVIYGTPTMYVDLLAKQKELNIPVTSAEIVSTGGAACTPELFRNIKSQLKVKKVKSVFGMTEVSAVIFQSLKEETEEQVLNTVGHIQEHVEAKVVDENGKAVPFGERGELWIRCYSNMLEYFGDPEKTKEMVDSDKWLKTGDQFILEEDGYGRIVGRIKEMIIRGGENLYPKEIEDFISTNPKVQETHVVGVPDERMGEEVCAFVKLKPGHTMDIQELKEFSRGKIAHFKVPRYLEVVDGFPKTQSGKIQKFKMVQKWREDFGPK